MRMGFMCSLFFLAMGIGSGIGIGYAIFNSDDKKEDMTVTLQANTDNSVVALYWMEFNSSRSIYDSQSLFIQKDEILPVQDNVLTIALSESNIRENSRYVKGNVLVLCGVLVFSPGEGTTRTTITVRYML